MKVADKFRYVRRTLGGMQQSVAIVGTIALLLTLTPVRLPGAEMTPLEVVRQSTTELLSQVESQRDAIDADPTLARDLVRKVLTPHIDIERTSRWVLGKHWRKANPEQRERFVQEFRTLLVRIYASAVAELSGVEMEYLPLEDDAGANDVVVRTQLPQDKGQPLGIFYRMHRTGDTWKVYDVTVDGVSLVTTYRSSFAAEVRRGGIQGLIDRLTEKNRT